MALNFKPTVTGNSRVFIIEGRARFDHRPAYQSNMKAGGVSQSFGDVEDIEIPSPYEFGKYIKVGEIRSQVDRVEVTLTGRYAADLKSELLRMAKAGCAVDIHINIGSCTTPSDYNLYSKKIIIENAFLTDYEQEDLGALGSDEEAKVDESATVSGRLVYEIVNPSYASRAGDIVTNELVAVTKCDNASCGGCEESSDGCSKFFAVTLAAGGSPGTPADVVYSLDGGATFYAHDVDTMGTTDDPTDVGCLGSYLFVTSEDTESLHYALLSEFTTSDDPSFTEVTTGFVSGGGPRAADSTNSKAFIVGAGGYIYDTQDVSSGVTVRDAGVLTIADYNDVSALNDEFAVAVGNDGVIAVTENGTQWSLASLSPVGVGVDINTVQVKSESEWIVGTSAGYVYHTINGGTTWTVGTFPGSGSGIVRDIKLANDSVMYMAHSTTAPAGRILRSIDGGYDWIVEPGTSATLPANDRVNALATCSDNPDKVIGVGLADDGSDGFIVVGSD